MEISMALMFRARDRTLSPTTTNITDYETDDRVLPRTVHSTTDDRVLPRTIHSTWALDSTSNTDPVG